MRIPRQHGSPGIALLMVLIIITVLGILAGGFSYSMKVETKLARNASFDTDLEWLGRSGIEYAKYLLVQASAGPGGQIDSLNQRWAGGPGDTNNPASAMPLENVPLGNGSFSVKIADMDRKFNINSADPIILNEALTIVGIDAAVSSTIVDSILDWRDPDDDRGMSGAESDQYQTLSPPYLAKNGPIDDLTELLLINGITPAMYWGQSAGGHAAAVRRPRSRSNFDEESYVVGLADLFTPVSGRLLNINTASATALQVLPGIDENMAQAIITARAGPDGADGTEDDMPFRSPAELGRVPAMPPMLVTQISRYCSVKSLVFEVKVDAEIAGAKRQYTALVRRNARDTAVLNISWR